MANKQKGKLDVTTFFYGFGASVVLVGSMFKFVGWDYANELFITGLSIEALVFFVSAFERSSIDKTYQWENVFPQLTSENGSEVANLISYQDAMKQFSSTLGELSTQIKGLNESLGAIKTEMSSNAEASKEMHGKVNVFNQQLDEYNQHMLKINARYREFLASDK
jgi:septal ring factor EnvC (AmiA/AmiB activator)